MTAPLTPADCDLRDFHRIMVDIPRLRGSDFDATLDDSAWRAGFNLWLTAWHQVPAASLSADDATLAKAAGLGRDLRTWKRVKAIALDNWVECDDGRLYHPTVAEIALESWLEKLQQRISSGAGNAKRWGGTFDATPIEAEIARCSRMLAALNPASKALAKAQRKRKPVASDQDNERNPDGNEKPSQRDAKPVPPGSQETGTGTGIYSEGKPSAANGQVNDPDAMAWTAAKALLTSQGGMSEDAAGRFFGKLIRDNGMAAREMLVPIASATANRTQDPRSFLIAAATKRKSGTTAEERMIRSNIQ